MNILLLNTSDRTGGAAVAANRLMRVLRKQGVNVRMLVRDKGLDDDVIMSVNFSYLHKKLNYVRFVWERLVIFICNFFSKRNLFQVSIANVGIDISQKDVFKKADVIHLHWINQGFLSLSDIKRIINSGKPIVWTMHDLWPATGICHYPGVCRKYQTQCIACSLLGKRTCWDLAKQVFRQKQKIDWSKIHFVGCSHWIMQEGKKSTLLKDAHFHVIPNPIDISVFSKKDQIEARAYFQLPSEKHLILFAAAKVSDERKGLEYLIKACSLLSSSFLDIEVILMGGNGEELRKQLPFKAHLLGYLSGTEQIVNAYSCADVFVTPSLEDNLPNTIMESMACGTPCIGFNTGGIPEMIDHLENGYVARYKDAEDLARGIAWALDYPDKKQLSDACVEKVKREYAEDVVAQRYMQLYEELLK